MVEVGVNVVVVVIVVVVVMVVGCALSGFQVVGTAAWYLVLSTWFQMF